MLAPSLKIYLINKSKQRTVRVIEKSMPFYMPFPGSGNQQTMPEVKVNINLDDLLKGRQEQAPVVIDQNNEQEALRKLEERKMTFIPFEDRDDVKVEFDEFGSKFESKE
jgi:hypothetical protein